MWGILGHPLSCVSPLLAIIMIFSIVVVTRITLLNLDRTSKMKMAKDHTWRQKPEHATKKLGRSDSKVNASSFKTVKTFFKESNKN